MLGYRVFNGAVWRNLGCANCGRGKSGMEGLVRPLERCRVIKDRNIVGYRIICGGDEAMVV